MDFILPRFPKNHWEITKINDFPLIFDENLWFFNENQWKIMDFRDFPMILGKSGRYEIHPPKLCASLEAAASCRVGPGPRERRRRPASGCSGPSAPRRAGPARPGGAVAQNAVTQFRHTTSKCFPHKAQCLGSFLQFEDFGP